MIELFCSKLVSWVFVHCIFSFNCYFVAHIASNNSAASTLINCGSDHQRKKNIVRESVWLVCFYLDFTILKMSFFLWEPFKSCLPWMSRSFFGNKLTGTGPKVRSVLLLWQICFAAGGHGLFHLNWELLWPHVEGSEKKIRNAPGLLPS